MDHVTATKDSSENKAVLVSASQPLIEICWACQDVVIRFTSHFDAQEYGAMEQYFAPDGVWKRGDGDLTGIAGLREGLLRRSPHILVRHLLSNLRTQLLTPDDAVVDAYFVAYREHRSGLNTAVPAPLTQPVLIGRYSDKLRRYPEGWRIYFRQAQIDFDATR